ncbi:MAG: M48 family metalloprotease [Betaproteobacteria bacterium]|nr:M48 family metalloprotease [Betaproteobacteria bacterium]
MKRRWTNWVNFVAVLAGLLGANLECFAAAPIATAWDAEQLAKSRSELTSLLDGENRPVATISVFRLRKLLDVMSRMQSAAGTTARLLILHTVDGGPNALAYSKDGAAKVFITTSMLDLLGDDFDSYAYLIGHELAHIEKDHGVQRAYLREMISVSRELDDTRFKGRAGLTIAGESAISAIAFDAAFSRDNEREADALAFRRMTYAGFDPRGALRLHNAISSAATLRRVTFLDTHPSDKERIFYLEKMVAAATASGGRIGGVSMESTAAPLAPGDEGFALLAEAIATIKKENISTVEDRTLVAGCHEGLARQNSDLQAPGRDANLKDIVALLITAKRQQPRFADEQIVACLEGMVASIDRRSIYIDGEDARSLQAGSTPIAGLGIEFKIQDDVPRVVRTIDGSPASVTALRDGDLVTAVDGVSTKGMLSKQFVARLRGPAGSPITLTVEKPGLGGPLELRLIRAPIRIQSVSSRVLSSVYGFIKIRQFQPSTLESLAAAFQQLDAETGGKLRGIVLDLRDNAGGILSTSVGTAAAFLPDGVLLAETKGRTRSSTMRITASTSFYVPPKTSNPFAAIPARIKIVPIVVLVNEETGAGAEIVAGALQDHRRAVILGRRTAGVGMISNTFPLKNNNALKLTIAQFTRANGDAITDIGVIPDITLDQKSGRDPESEDIELQQALKIVGERAQQ